MQRLRPPLLFPCQTRRLPRLSSPCRVAPRVPEPLKVMFGLSLLANAIELPAEPPTVAVMNTVPPDPPADTVAGISVFTAVRILVAAELVLVPTETSPGLTRDATHVKVCGPITNVRPIVPAPDTLIV